ncbi:hypothetical protein QO034_23145 [Sedimentitalea sp. JM2-8]|uniref:DNA-directed DNA polymerase family A palm domain-containing protein n=1 Tax=Sedimentitalea xiamensis TaxID=3050037 RepID=A0ABT7FLA3_9RHOB|nr:hypothetical protein [Sedimentitalea xiamensis]MDK3075946.1 hypothetical protein [Sedimentitalea xiamensis]
MAWLEDPELCIGVSMSPNTWDTSSRYNAIHISKKILPIIRALSDANLIDLARGSYSGPYVPGNRTTRIRASAELQGWFAKAAFDRSHVGRVEGEEIIILRDSKEGLVEYDDTDETNLMREELTHYNNIIASAFIDIPTLATPDIDGVPVDQYHKRTRRIFSRSDWGCNGRFYGGWWQRINSKMRREIFINDTPTVEVDFRSLHVSILSLERGVELTEDPYDLPEKVLGGIHPDLQRTFIKKLVLTAINADAKDAAFRAFRDGFPKGHHGKQMTNSELEKLLEAFLAKSPHLEDALFADHGIRLMNQDGRMADYVQRYFAAQDVPVLSVHDSFIIDYTRVSELKDAMSEASRRVVGKPLPTSNQFLGIDEGKVKSEVLLDYIRWRQTPRCPEYLQRLREHEDRTGVEIAPYG